MGKSRNGGEAWFKRNGENSVPQTKVLIKLARVFDVNVNWLLLGKGQPFRRKAKASPGKSKPEAPRLRGDAGVPSEKPTVLPQSDPEAKKNG